MASIPSAPDKVLMNRIGSPPILCVIRASPELPRGNGRAIRQLDGRRTDPLPALATDRANRTAAMLDIGVGGI